MVKSAAAAAAAKLEEHRVTDAVVRAASASRMQLNEFPEELADSVRGLAAQRGFPEGLACEVFWHTVASAVKTVNFHLKGGFGADGTTMLSLIAGPSGARPASFFSIRISSNHTP